MTNLNLTSLSAFAPCLMQSQLNGSHALCRLRSLVSTLKFEKIPVNLLYIKKLVLGIVAGQVLKK